MASTTSLRGESPLIAAENFWEIFRKALSLKPTTVHVISDEAEALLNKPNAGDENLPDFAISLPWVAHDINIQENKTKRVEGDFEMDIIVFEVIYIHSIDMGYLSRSNDVVKYTYRPNKAPYKAANYTLVFGLNSIIG